MLREREISLASPTPHEEESSLKKPHGNQTADPIRVAAQVSVIALDAVSCFETLIG